ncbi:RING-H2 finger protein ATL56-like [Miscanthus floridulus]|uniref:RING-H2 finger protein ATL56-like n=1 Tax=Miscanthus floridulus TaxID=154761 RepID=UPI0034585FF8
MEGSTLHRIVFITVGLVLMVVLHLVVAICVLSRTSPSRRVAEHAEEESGGAGLSAEEVGGLPCHEFKEGAGGGECAVCLDVFRSGDRCRVLPRCGHRFHADCLDSWLRKSRRCPVCRTEAVEQRKDATGAVAATVEIVTQG